MTFYQGYTGVVVGAAGLFCVWGIGIGSVHGHWYRAAAFAWFALWAAVPLFRLWQWAILGVTQ